MGRNQRALVFVVIAVFMVSVFGSAIFILADSGSSSNNDPAADLAEQAELQDAALQEQALQDQLAQQCALLPAVEQPENPSQLPAFDLPQGDVTSLEIIDIQEGTGKEAQPGDCVVAYYHGTLTDGTVFDSAYERSAPSRFSLLRVIPGWQDGVPGMKEGGVRVLYIPSEQAYGPNGSPPVIGPNEDLVFVVELVEVVEI